MHYKFMASHAHDKVMAMPSQNDSNVNVNQLPSHGKVIAESSPSHDKVVAMPSPKSLPSQSLRWKEYSFLARVDLMCAPQPYAKGPLFLGILKKWHPRTILVSSLVLARSYAKKFLAIPQKCGDKIFLGWLPFRLVILKWLGWRGPIILKTRMSHPTF